MFPANRQPVFTPRQQFTDIPYKSSMAGPPSSVFFVFLDATVNPWYRTIQLPRAEHGMSPLSIVYGIFGLSSSLVALYAYYSLLPSS
jgi:hypothetical protein